MPSQIWRSTTEASRSEYVPSSLMRSNSSPPRQNSMTMKSSVSVSNTSYMRIMFGWSMVFITSISARSCLKWNSLSALRRNRALLITLTARSSPLGMCTALWEQAPLARVRAPPSRRRSRRMRGMRERMRVRSHLRIAKLARLANARAEAIVFGDVVGAAEHVEG
jgi:hypothetical protein